MNFDYYGIYNFILVSLLSKKEEGESITKLESFLMTIGDLALKNDVSGYIISLKYLYNGFL